MSDDRDQLHRWHRSHPARVDLYEHTITLEEYRALQLDRPLTGDTFGGGAHKRSRKVTGSTD